MGQVGRPCDNDRRAAVARRALVGLASWCALTVVVVVALNEAAPHPDPDTRAIVRMGAALLVIWVVGGGLLMRAGRRPFVAAVSRNQTSWARRFVLLCILFALVEEAITTTLTNLAPTLGGVTDKAAITASTNYLDVVLLHSVVWFVPMFITWAWLLRRYDFQPIEVLLLFGLNGTLAESLTFGPQHVLEVGMWTFVYGLMVWLPACTVPVDRAGARPVAWRTWLLAVFAPVGWPIGLIVLAVRRRRARAGSRR